MLTPNGAQVHQPAFYVTQASDHDVDPLNAAQKSTVDGNSGGATHESSADDIPGLPVSAGDFAWAAWAVATVVLKPAVVIKRSLIMLMLASSTGQSCWRAACQNHVTLCVRCGMQWTFLLHALRRAARLPCAMYNLQRPFVLCTSGKTVMSAWVVSPKGHVGLTCP
jgi:hypothetical protein